MALTNDDAALYDRQIRLWGVDAQQRIQRARVLVVGVTALAAEVCKNIVLAGVAHVTLADPAPVTPNDLVANFLLDPATALGANRAQAATARLVALNPRLQLRALETAAISDEEIAAHDVVCAVHAPRAALIDLDARCRTRDVAFFAGDVFGLLGFVFADLGERHEYIEERKQPAKHNKDETETVVTARHERYVSLETALARNVAKLSERKRRGLDRTRFVLDALWRYWAAHGALPDPDTDAKCLDELAAVQRAVLIEAGLPADFVADETVRRAGEGALAEVAPVAAIVGGFFAQEVIKVVSHKELPINNFFFYDGLQGTGNVEQHEP